jgi:hypothetical protein
VNGFQLGDLRCRKLYRPDEPAAPAAARDAAPHIPCPPPTPAAAAPAAAGAAAAAGGAAAGGMAM